MKIVSFSKKKMQAFVAAYVFALANMVSEAQAAGNIKSNINTLIQAGSGLNTGITVGFGIFALFKWIEYFGDFKPESALKNALVPAMLTFLTFQWATVLGWVLG